MLTLGKCVLCSKEVSLVLDDAVRDGRDFPAGNSSGSRVSLLISPLAFLLSLGWLTRGLKDEDWQDLLKRHAGENFREFVGSRVCPECFPSDPDDDRENIDEERDDEDSDEDGDENSDEDGDDPVFGLLVRSDGNCKKVLVSSVREVCKILGCDSADYYYEREFAIWIYRSDRQSPRSKVNVYASSIANSFISGDCVLLYDLDNEGTRVDYWTNMGNQWFDSALFQMIERCNNDADAISFLERHRM